MKNKKFFLLYWDDNILVMPSKIYLDKLFKGNWIKISVNSEELKSIKNKIGKNYRLRSDSFDEFKREKKFISDLKYSLENKKFGPCFEKFKNALINVEDFGIITARGHSPNNLKNGVKFLVKHVLTPKEKKIMIKNLGKTSFNHYLNRQKYRTVSSPQFFKEFNLNGDHKIEIGKKIAYTDYIENVVRGTNISVGYSDDDLTNVKVIETLIKKELKNKFPNIKFVIYDTSNPNKIKKKVINGGH